MYIPYVFLNATGSILCDCFFFLNNIWLIIFAFAPKLHTYIVHMVIFYTFFLKIYTYITSIIYIYIYIYIYITPIVVVSEISNESYHTVHCVPRAVAELEFYTWGGQG